MRIEHSCYNFFRSPHADFVNDKVCRYSTGPVWNFSILKEPGIRSLGPRTVMFDANPQSSA